MKIRLLILAFSLFLFFFNGISFATTDTTILSQINKLINESRDNLGSNNEQAYKLSEQALALSKKYKLKKQEATSLKMYGYYYLYVSKFEEAIKYFERSLLISENEKDTSGIIDGHYMIGQGLFYQSNYKKANNHYSFALKLAKEIKDTLQQANLFFELGYIQYSQSNLKIALKYFQDGLALAEKVDAGDQIVNSFYNSIGDIYFEWGNYDDAKTYYIRAYKLAEKSDKAQGKAFALNNLGNVYLKQNQFELALKKYSDAKTIFEKGGYLQGVSIALHNIGMTYEEMGNNLKAIRLYEESARIKQDIGDRAGLSETLGFIGNLLITEGELSQAISRLEKSQKIAIDINLQGQIKENYKSLSKAYKLLGNSSKSLDYFEKFFAIHDSLFNSETQTQFTEMQTRFETEQKEKEIELLNKEKVLKDKELIQKNEILSKQRTIITTIIIGFILVLVFSIIVFRLFRQKKIANEILKQQKEEILSQRDEIASQRDQIEDKNIEINIINKDLTASIRYALRIQQALLPDKEEIVSLLGEHFLLYLPKDIVSGDFYWITNKMEADGSNTIVLACADCTGHGVPGAFMSIIGMNLLEKAVHSEKLVHPAEILNYITNNIYSLIRHSSSTSELKDGMDIALCSFNKKRGKLEYAGARNSLVLISEGRLTEIKGDKHFIGDKIGSTTFKGYQNHHININTNDILYMYSDGYADQFGGQSRKKYMSSRLKEILHKNSHKSMEKQGEILLEEHFKWKKNEAQVDDILVVGLKI